jgi:co-chaperonin GroES (HSP10)
MDSQALQVQQEAQLDHTHSKSSDIPEGYIRLASGQLFKVARKRGKAKAPDLNNFAPLGARTRFYPYGDEIVVKVDRFADEATCKACKGTGHSDSTCPTCAGNKGSWYDVDGTRDNRSTANRDVMTFRPCQDCRAAQYGDPILRSTGRVPCKPCSGQGQALGESKIALSTDYEDVPTTGIVLAIGPICKRIARGDRIMFARFCGQEYEYEGRKYRIMKENYPMGKIVGNDEIRVKDAAQVG